MNIIKEIATHYKTDDQSLYKLSKMAREGIPYSSFTLIVEDNPFDLSDWAKFLDISERTLQRYKKEDTTFSLLHSEKILEIALLNLKGIEVFGNKENYHTWLDSKSIALGGIKPRELLDNHFGIELIRGELIRIEHGVLA